MLLQYEMRMSSYLVVGTLRYVSYVNDFQNYNIIIIKKIVLIDL